MKRDLRFTAKARADLERLYTFLADHDVVAARRALEAIDRSWPIIQQFPYACRKAEADNPLLREMVISFGNTGYVALFEIESEHLITVLAVRHQREEDYH